MGNDITLNKTTAFLMAGLFLAIVVGGYLAFGASGPGAQPGDQPEANPPVQPSATGAPSGGVQEVYLKASSGGYDKSEITVKKGVPVKLHFTAQNAGCGSYLVIYGLNVKVLSKGQEAVVEFTPQQEGTYEFNCGMRMFPPGKFVVTA
jgi:heme/copper-type cytochrome/quinol oxidase subunit 2